MAKIVLALTSLAVIGIIGFCTTKTALSLKHHIRIPRGSVIKIVQPIIDGTSRIVHVSVDKAGAVVSKIIPEKFNVTFFVKKSRKERKADKKIQNYMDKRREKDMNQIKKQTGINPRGLHQSDNFGGANTK